MIGKTFKNRIAVECAALTFIFGSAALLGQSTPATPSSPVGAELPVLMRQNVIAGKTPVGAKVEAKLTVATLVNGTVIPKDAIFSGEVTESTVKSAADPSRLGILMSSVQWKNGSAPIKVYLTAWYYPIASIAPQDLSYGPTDAEHTPHNWNGDGPYYDPKSPVYQPLPGQSADKSKDPHAAPGTSNHRVLMKDVDCLRSVDGAIIIASKHSNIKIDKSTTYVLAPDGLIPSIPVAK